ncbi:glycosyltransferase family 2 protein [Pseudoalteromonas neustonica]|uniref:Glycosyltransferase family 2 protein n=1 Tax=Pseudoalteromonas neustonica TaxID=1840331 RepID=A0ABU9U250_9GAMM
MDKITIVIVCYNCGEDIFNAITDIKNGYYENNHLQIIVVDNDSHDDSVALLRNIEGFDLKIIESKNNLGFGSGCNLALPHIKANKTLFLNPDVRLNETSITSLVDFSNSHPNAKVWGGQTINPQGQIDGQNAWREPSLRGVLSWSFFGDILLKKLSRRIPDAYTTDEINRLPYVDSISGCFLLMDTDLLKELNGFDERFFMYSEEVDLCRRARKLGAKPMSTSQAVIVHEGSKTITSQNKLNFLYHSKLKYCKKYWNPLSYSIARLSLFCGAVLRAFAYSLLSFQKLNRAEAKVWWMFCRQQLKWEI